MELSEVAILRDVIRTIRIYACKNGIELTESKINEVSYTSLDLPFFRSPKVGISSKTIHLYLR